MSTEQSYVGRGTCATPTEQTGKKPAQTAQNEAQHNTATIEELKPLLDSWASMHQWAIDSLCYIRRRQHLSATEKARINFRLDQYATYLGSLIQFYSSGTRKLPLGELDTQRTNHQEGQATFNQYAQYYEFPRYPLDPAIKPKEESLLGFLFEVCDDSYNPILFHKDHLFTDKVNSLAQIKPADLLCITYRQDYKRPRFFRIGWFKRIMGNYLILAYDRPRLEVKQPDWGISLHDVVHIYKVATIQRDY